MRTETKRRLEIKAAKIFISSSFHLLIISMKINYKT
jgi:hypothetical protein